MAAFAEYLKKIEKALERGDATEHTHRPALKELIESLGDGLTATNEPKRVKCGAPDYVVSRGDLPIGYVEAKDVNVPLDQIEKTGQLQRYLEALPNIILTDYIEFRLYLDGEACMAATLATADSTGKLKNEKGGAEKVKKLFHAFFDAEPPEIENPEELADRMARLGRLVRDGIGLAFQDEDKGGNLHLQLKSFRETLLGSLKENEFADMYAQTICYGLFTARCNHPTGKPFTRQNAPHELPKTNPFLRKMFGHIAGPELDSRIIWAVDELAELLNRANIGAILRDFGKRTKREDPVVHFYETFLAAYNPKMREMRGVYYTPEPVVSYIVRSIDHILKTDFGLPKGLADDSRLEVETKKGETAPHKVQILDPATGTGTFLYGVINQIYDYFEGDKGMWSGYVTEHLLPRLFGFELLMAPYAVAHMKLGLRLAETGYDFKSDERLRVYLTNALDEPVTLPAAEGFTAWITEEADQAISVKQDKPVMVVLGNPPYSYESANTGDWISKLVRDYYRVDGKPLKEKNPKGLQDDYVKFIRFGQWRVEQTGYGILAFISNHGYLDNPTFRGMRQSLMETFDDIYILDLHGNSKKKEKTPKGEKDDNVFDIQLGVAIGIFVKRNGSKKKYATVYHSDLWGVREVFQNTKDGLQLISGKYADLYKTDTQNTAWKTLTPASPEYIFSFQNIQLRNEYDELWKIDDISKHKAVGIATSRDHMTIQYTPNDIFSVVKKFVSLEPEEARDEFSLGEDTHDWKVTLAQEDIKQAGINKELIKMIIYRPFDYRFTYYTGKTRGFISRPRFDLIQHMLFPNRAIFLGRQGQAVGTDSWDLVFCGKYMEDYNL